MSEKNILKSYLNKCTTSLYHQENLTEKKNLYYKSSCIYKVFQQETEISLGLSIFMFNLFVLHTITVYLKDLDFFRQKKCLFRNNLRRKNYASKKNLVFFITVICFNR